MADNQKTLSPFFTTLVIMFSDCMPWIGALRKIFDIRSTVKYPVSVMLFGILIIRFLADLTQTFSSRQTLNPPYFTYMVNYQSNCLFVSFIRFIFFVFFFFFNMCFKRSADVWAREKYPSSKIGLHTILNIAFDRRPIIANINGNTFFSLVDTFV